MEQDATFVHLLIKDQILEVTYKEGLHINYEIAEKIVRDRLLFTNGKKIPAIINCRGIISIDKRAREYLASVEGTKGLSATAIIVDSDYSRLLGNFFLYVNKTKMPVKIFRDIDKSVIWLHKYII